MIEKAALHEKDGKIRIVYHLLGVNSLRFTLFWGTFIFLFCGFAFKFFFIFPFYCFIFYVLAVIVVYYDFKRKDFGIITFGCTKNSISISKYGSNPYAHYFRSYDFDKLKEIRFSETDWTIAFVTHKDHLFQLSRDIPLTLIKEALEIMETKMGVPCPVKFVRDERLLSVDLQDL